MSFLEVKAQEDSSVSLIISGLKDSGVDTILVYEEGSTGIQTLRGDSCKSDIYENSDVYIIYLDHARCFLKRVDNCYIYKAIQFPFKDVFSFYFQNKKYFIEMKNYYERVRQSTKDNKPIFLPPVPVHHSYKSIELISPKDSISFNVVDKFEYDKGGNPLYLDFKWMRKKKQWTDLLSRRISKVDEVKFIKERNR